jgi:monofunctional biosynthetic peptidoglycan transglycosylase
VRSTLAAVIILYTLEATALLYLRYLPPLTTAVQIQNRVTALVSGKTYQKSFQPVALSATSPDLQHAVIAAEDARFYDHHGIDWKQVSKVTEESLESGSVERGASTISQQLVKNLFLTNWRSPVRKGLEFLLVFPAELILGKQRILELYLNVIEWGPGVYGAEAASQYHFKTTAKRVNRDQAARLAAILPAPTTRRPSRMNDYSSAILTRMRQMGW